MIKKKIIICNSSSAFFLISFTSFYRVTCSLICHSDSFSYASVYFCMVHFLTPVLSFLYTPVLPFNHLFILSITIVSFVYSSLPLSLSLSSYYSRIRLCFCLSTFSSSCLSLSSFYPSISLPSSLPLSSTFPAFV